MFGIQFSTQFWYTFMSKDKSKNKNYLTTTTIVDTTTTITNTLYHCQLLASSWGRFIHVFLICRSFKLHMESNEYGNPSPLI